MENATINQNWKALIKPNKLQIENNKDKSITTVVAEPLEKGYALTIGNSLRRILLSSIQGSAITSIQINMGSGNLDANSEITVYGSEGTEIPATVFYAIAGTIFEESDTGKHYMWDGTDTWNEVA